MNSTKMLHQIHKEGLERFDREFTTSHKGDTGLGGNTPTEPVYEINDPDPINYKRFLTSHTISILEAVIKQCEGMKRKHGVLYFDMSPEDQVWKGSVVNATLDNVIRSLQQEIEKIRK